MKAVIILRRLGLAVITLFLVTVFTYAIFFWLSPDPAVQICGQTCTPERIETIRVQLGVDRPFPEQLWTFIAGLFVGRSMESGTSVIECVAPCLGYSFQTGQQVTTMLVNRFPTTLTLAIGACILWLVSGVLLGIVAALRRHTWLDGTIRLGALVGIALPNYFVALLLQYIFVVQLGVLPFPQNVAFGQSPSLWFNSYLLAWIVLAMMYAAMYTRITRANVIETMSENYVRTARAKGLSQRVVIGKHALRPALTPLVTLTGMDFAALLGGALITETVFGLNGIGKMARDAISTNDQPVIMGFTLVAAAFVVIANLVIDLLYSVLDPRVRTGESR
ncbi:ABC transporter permease [Citricoccus sp. I39-566]|uniref:ABC transporter permease n=1 Tax=Citricoccus sp. I39-566 TaxID=3073268 RepID=UPI00286D1B77|nr:ABC transporter permease [Citricoccus sp. I39-566]WMY78456.1 ABC transporter permease [Citricoccus sp. I39-566]